MARRSIADLHAQLRVDGTRLRADINKSTRILRRQLGLQAQAINRVFSRALTIGLTGAFTAASGAAFALTRAVNTSRREIEALLRESDQLGLAVQDFQALSRAAEEAGSTTEAITAAMGSLRDAIADAVDGNENLQASFARLGLDFENLATLNPFEAALQAGEALQQFADNPIQLATLGRDIFGPQVSQIATLLQGGIRNNVDAAQGFLGSTGQTITTPQARAVLEMNTAIKELGRAMRGLINQLTIEIAPIITQLAEQLTREIGILNSKIPELDVFESLGEHVANFGEAMERTTDKMLIIGQSLSKMISLLDKIDWIFTILGAGAGVRAVSELGAVGFAAKGAFQQWRVARRLNKRGLKLSDLEAASKNVPAPTNIKHLSSRLQTYSKELDLRRVSPDIKGATGFPLEHLRGEPRKRLQDYIQKVRGRMGELKDHEAADVWNALQNFEARQIQSVIKQYVNAVKTARTDVKDQVGTALDALSDGVKAIAAFTISGFADDLEDELIQLEQALKSDFTRSDRDKIQKILDEIRGAQKRFIEQIEIAEQAQNIIEGGIANSQAIREGLAPGTAAPPPELRLPTGFERDETLQAMQAAPILQQYQNQILEDRKRREEEIKAAQLRRIQLVETIEKEGGATAARLTAVGRATEGIQRVLGLFRDAMSNVPYLDIDAQVIALERTMRRQADDVEKTLPPDSRAFAHPFADQLDELSEIRDTMKSISAETSKVDTLLTQFDAAGIRELGYQLENTADSLDPFTDRFKSLKRDLDAIRETPMGEILAEDINRITTLIEYTEAGVFQVFDSLRNNIGSAIDALIDTGKFKFRDFFAGVLRDMAKIYARLALFGQSGAGGLLGSIAFSVFGSVFGAAVMGGGAGLNFGFGGEGTATAIEGGGFGNTTGEVTTISNNPELLPGFASGGRFDTSSPFVVGERGPEVVVPRSAGYVVPNDAFGKMNDMPTVNVTQNIQAGVNQSELSFALEQAKQDLRREIMDDLTGGGRMYNAIEQITT